MGLPLSNAQSFTYADYLRWEDGHRWELIQGLAYAMTPAPSTRHQQVLLALASRFALHLKGGNCQVFVAPFDVRLPVEDEADEEVETVVQPDISIFCDPAKIDKRWARGAPDLVVEILSPATARKDMVQKLLLYQSRGVPEYWLVDPEKEVLQVLRLTPDKVYTSIGEFSPPASVSPALANELEIELAEVFGR
jgi:Uma2 family endonuclease